MARGAARKWCVWNPVINIKKHQSETNPKTRATLNAGKPLRPLNQHTAPNIDKFKNVFWSFDTQDKFSSELWNNWGKFPPPYKVSAHHHRSSWHHLHPHPTRKVFFMLIIFLWSFKNFVTILHHFMLGQARHYRPAYLFWQILKFRQIYKYCNSVKHVTYVE